MFIQQSISIILILFITFNQIEIGYCSNSNTHSESALEKTSGWIGSSMGRRLKRNPKDDLGYLNTNKDDLITLAEFIQENPWTVFAGVPEGQKRQMNFTPRLGRQLNEENIQYVPNAERWVPDSELALSSGDMSVRSPQFSPRLGRRVGSPFGQQSKRYA